MGGSFVAYDIEELWDVQYQEGVKIALNATGLKPSSALGLVEGLLMNHSAKRDIKITITPSIYPKEEKRERREVSRIHRPWTRHCWHTTKVHLSGNRTERCCQPGCTARRQVGRDYMKPMELSSCTHPNWTIEREQR